MNAKKLKNLRKMLRLDGFSIRDAKYNLSNKLFRMVDSGELNEDGTPKMTRFDYQGTIKLEEGCGRHVYKHMKAALA